MYACLAQHLQYNDLVNIIGKLPSTVLLAIAAGCVIAFPSAVEAGQGVSIMSVRAWVSPTVVMKFEASSMQLSVTEDDIARGYIDVPGTYRLTINAGRTMRHLANIIVDYEPNPYVTSIQVAARTLQIGEPSSDTMLVAVANYINGLPATAAGPSDEPQKHRESDRSVDRSVKTFDGAETVSVRGSVTSLGYRLILPEKIKPGNISVPLTLSLQL
jgi:hypothetical protein